METVSVTKAIGEMSVIAQDLDTPWAIVFLPSGELLVTERAGRVRIVDKNGNLDKNPIATLSNVKEIGEGGLLGMTLDPNFDKNNYIYFYYTYGSQSGNTKNRVVRMSYKDKKLSDEKVLIDAIPGSSNHNGGRIKFGPDGYLYITTGDAEKPSQAQDTTSPAGKILRVTKEGKPVAGNPFSNTIYSYGHRNPQGIAWDEKGQLWATEHGRSIPQSGLDEINLIEKGQNYGWPDIEGSEKKQGMQTPRAHSGDFTTWAPADIAILGENLFFAGLKGSAVYKATIKNNTITAVEPYFKDMYGRIREVILGPDTMLYVSTSNLDGRGNPREYDDKILRINPQTL